MKKSSKAVSIIESIIALLIITSWIIWLYAIYWEWANLSTATKNRIEAIQISRDWLEAFSNIRDTNWLLFSSDYTNCWNVIWYNNACIWSTWTWTDILAWSYIIYNDTDNRFQLLSWSLTNDYLSGSYRNFYKVQKDNMWFYTQSWWTDFWPLFTREIQVSYQNTSWATIDSNDQIMEIKSLVQRIDNTSQDVHKIEFENILTNWKNVKN